MMTAQPSEGHKDATAVQTINHVELYVSNIRQAAHFFRTVFGLHAAAALETDSDRCWLPLERNEIRVLLTAPMTASSPVAEHIRVHGEGIKDIGLAARGVDELFERAVAQGARPVQPPAVQQWCGNARRMARIGVCGELVHSLIEWDADGPAWPRGATPEHAGRVSETGLEAIDHVALALRRGELDRWVEFYTSALGFVETHQENVSTEYSAMRSKVVGTLSGSVRFPMVEPAEGRRASQVDDYVRSHEGPGAQHLALRSNDIVKSASVMSDGIEFLTTPNTYYEALQARVGDLSSEMESLRRYGILVDRDASGLLLQVFSKPIGSRPTLFVEVIERRGAEGFGSGNIKALFEAVERMQTAGAA